MRSILILLMMFLFQQVNSLAQVDYEWYVYQANPSIIDLEFEGSFVWAATFQGVVKTNKTTGEKTFFTQANSDLPVDLVRAVAIDENGNKWFGTTNGGLAKFDGSNWTIYNTSNSDLPNDVIYGLTFDSEGNLWIGSLSYLTKFDGTTWTNWSFQGKRPIYKIAIDSQGIIWMATNSGLWKFDEVDIFYYHNANSDLPGDNLLTHVSIDDNDDIWIGTKSGMAKFDRTNWTIYTTANSGLPDNWINCIAFDSNGDKWIATHGGVAKYDGTNWTVFNSTNSGIKDHLVNVIIIDSKGDKWIASQNGGIAFYNNIKWTVYNQSNSGLPYNYITSIAIDDKGDKWIGMVKEGLAAKFDGSDWTVYDTSNSAIPNYRTRDIAIDVDGSKWFASEGGGVIHYNGSEWSSYTTSNSGLPHNFIMSIFIDNDNNKWFGTSAGLAKYDGSDWTVYNTGNSGLPNNSVQQVIIDNSGYIWVGTGVLYGSGGDGLARFDGATWTVFNTSNSDLPENNIKALEIDDDGTAWIGTDDGFAMYDGSDWRVYDTSNSRLPLNDIKCVNIDDNGLIWIGTNAGFVTFDGSNWTLYDSYSSGLAGPGEGGVYCVTIDQNNNKWMGTAGGMAFYSAKIYSERVEGTFCRGDRFNIDFTVGEIFNPDNEFTAQLSEPNGIFYNDSIPKVIGTLSSRNSGTIQVTIPQGISASDKYRIRVSGSSPFARGVDNGIDLLMASTPEPELSGPDEAYPGSKEKYLSEEFDDNYWSVTSGQIEDSSSKSIEVRWGGPGTGSVTLKMINENGCADSVTQNVDISIPDLIILGDTKVCEYTTEKYTTERLEGGEVTWTVESGGSIVGGNTGDTVEVQWDGPGQGSLKLTQLINSYPKDKVIDIEILTQPSMPIIVRNGNDLRSSATSGNQWFHNDTIIPGATGQTYSPVDYGGFFQVQVTNQDGCISEISDKFDYEYIPRASFRIADGSDISAEAGAEVLLPIYIVPIDNITQAGVTSIRARVRFNANILIPVNAPFGTLEDDERVINLDMPLTQDNMLVNLNLRAALGNTKSTEIIMDSIEVVGGTLDLDEVSFSIVFTLAGVCTEGGTRLVGTGGSVALFGVHPNPASGSIELVYTTSESGLTRVLMFNSMGRVVRTLHDGSIKPGRHEQIVELSVVPSGVYYIVLQTTARRRAVRLDVVK